MDTRQEYDHKQLEGVDTNIEIALKEYGLAWIETEDDILFYYGIKSEDVDGIGSEYTRFDCRSVDKNVIPRKEYNWANFADVCSYIGVSQMGFNQMSLVHKIDSLLSYYGYENVFGSSYWEGLEYKDIVTE